MAREARRARFSRSRSNRRHATPTDRCRSAVCIIHLNPRKREHIAICSRQTGRFALRTYRNMFSTFCNGRSDLLLHNLPLTISVRPKLSSQALRRRVPGTSRQFDEWGEQPGERDSHKAVPIAVTPHRLIAAEVPLELSPLQIKYHAYSISGYSISSA